jgi:serpin B
MIVLLPKRVDGLGELEQSLAASSLEHWFGQLWMAPQVILTMPKFKVESQIGLEGILSSMGMPSAFVGQTADFTGMASKEEMKRQDGPLANLHVSAAIHEAFVDVNEKGTEAAAATVPVLIPTMACAGCGRPAPPRIIFRADHPFLFLMRDNKSGSIVFIGRVSNPAP